MSIIQKLENSYVAILRVVVIVVATVLLLVAVVMGVMSLKGMLPAANEEVEIGSVDPKDVLAEVTPSERSGSDAAPDATQPEQARENANPYLADYEKAYAVVAPFVSKTSKNAVEIDKERFFAVLEQNASEYAAEEIKAKYVSGLIDAFSTSLRDKRLIARVEKPLVAKQPPVIAPVQDQVAPEDGEEPVIQQDAPTPEQVEEEIPYKESPLVVVNDVLNAYNKMFNQKVAEATEKRDAAAAEHMEAAASAATRMYVAGTLFGAFLLVIFLTVAIRIERNLREIAAVRA